MVLIKCHANGVALVYDVKYSMVKMRMYTVHLSVEYGVYVLPVFKVYISAYGT